MKEKILETRATITEAIFYGVKELIGLNTIRSFSRTSNYSCEGGETIAITRLNFIS